MSVSNPFQERSQNMFNATKPQRSIPSGSSKMQSHGNSKATIQSRQYSHMYKTQVDYNQKKDSKENPTASVYNKGKSTSFYQTRVSSSITGPNSARAKLDFSKADTKARRQSYATSQQSRGGSIDKKMRASGQLKGKVTQSLVMTQKLDLKGSLNYTKRILQNESLGKKKSENDENPKHHSSVVVFSKKSNLKSSSSVSNFDISNAIGPQRTKSQVQATKKSTSDSELVISDSKQGDQEEYISTISSEFIKLASVKTCNEIFKERVSKMKQDLNLTKIDRADLMNPQMVSEYAQDIYTQMLMEETQAMVDPNYLQKVQTEIKDTSRAFLVEWIIDVHRKFRLTPECLYVATYIIDQYLSRSNIKKSELHLLGVTTLFVASKYEEIYPPQLRDFLAVSENKFSDKQVLKMELSILHTLNWSMTSPSSFRFLQRFRRMSDSVNTDEIFFFAQYIQEVQLLDASLLKFKQSEIAAASLILASKQLTKNNCWDENMVKFSGYTEEQLSEVVKEVKSFCMEINPKFISTLRYKFNKSEYKEVAKNTFKF